MPRIHAYSKTTAWVPDWRTDINRGDSSYQRKRQKAERTRAATILKYAPGTPVRITWRRTEGGKIIVTGILRGVVRWSADPTVLIATVQLDDGSILRVDAMRLTRRPAGTLQA